MKEAPYSIEHLEEKSFVLKDIIQQYLRYWPWFVLSIIFCIGLGYTYMRYASIIYRSEAKIKIIDESKEADIASSAISFLGGSSKINLDNETEILKSYRILSQVVNELSLDVSYYIVGNVKTTQIWAPPFQITKQMAADSLQVSRSYLIEFKAEGIIITDGQDNEFTPDLEQPDLPTEGLPFNFSMVEGIDPVFYKGNTYKVVLNPLKSTVLNLANALLVQPANKANEILSLILESESMDRNEAILNTLVEKFNQDGVRDRQLVSQRTLNFIDERFLSLSQELDSIEGGKESFKRSSNLSYIEADAGMSLQRKSVTEEQVIQLENQISILQILKETVINQSDYGLLPANIGIENTSLNNLVMGYNEISLEREKLLPTVGSNHPTLQNINGQLERAKVNIIKSVNIYGNQLRNSLGQLKQEESRAGSVFSRLPEKEKMLRSIERQQSIKENLFLLLLQKREEAAISYAVTAPTVKIVDYALTNNIPVSPKRKIVYAMSLMAGLFLPFAVLYIRFALDTKIHDGKDIENVTSEIPVVAEIPFFKSIKMQMKANDRSILAESFRILSTNVDYLLAESNREEGQVIMVTSSVIGEGKTFLALNLSKAYASLDKKVLLVGADLRNPQLHSYYDLSVNHKGLSDYLKDPEMNWRDCVVKGNTDHPMLDVCYGGSIPPNPPQLLSSDAFEKFIKRAKGEYAYIIMDTAPTMLVTDTLIISKYADATLFVTRSGLTDKDLLDFSKNLFKTKKLRNMAYVVNGVGKGKGKGKGYNYGYGYGYGSE